MSIIVRTIKGLVNVAIKALARESDRLARVNERLALEAQKQAEYNEKAVSEMFERVKAMNAKTKQNTDAILEQRVENAKTAQKAANLAAQLKSISL